MTDELSIKDVDALAQEIRRVDGSHSLGAGALAEALAPYLRAYAREAIRQQWRPISEAPKNESVLVFASGQQFVAWFQDDATDPLFEDDFKSDWDQMWLVTDNRNGPYPLRGGRPTHFQPLPSPPAGEVA